MIIKPYGFAVWERIQRALDDRFKATGHENFYFPLLFPMSLLAKEEEHLEGFIPQVALVTKGGGQDLEEPLVIRPTSEAVIWSTYARWIQSYRDLPLLYNQWCNVLRWEMRTRLFLRTSEFLWQEGHTAHATRAEAVEEAIRMHGVYREVVEDVLAIPMLAGRKSESERFPGADETYTIEGLMRDKKALQGATSHFLGQNFSKAYGVTFLNEKGEQDYAWGTSWGFSARMVGGTIMAHGDDKGLRLPPMVAPTQVVLIPIYKSDDEMGRVVQAASRIHDELTSNGVRARVDDRDQYRPGFKFSEWELKGVPVRMEIGPRDVESSQVVIVKRTSGTKETVPTSEAVAGMADLLGAVQTELYEDALSFRTENTHEVESFDQLRDGLRDGGFFVGPWCGNGACEEKVSSETTATIRVLAIEAEDPRGPCVVCGEPGTERATWARAY
jgi:prolyl-tRNA synthetase